MDTLDLRAPVTVAPATSRRHDHLRSSGRGRGRVRSAPIRRCSSIRPPRRHAGRQHRRRRTSVRHHGLRERDRRQRAQRRRSTSASSAAFRRLAAARLRLRLRRRRTTSTWRYQDAVQRGPGPQRTTAAVGAGLECLFDVTLTGGFADMLADLFLITDPVNYNIALNQLAGLELRQLPAVVPEPGCPLQRHPRPCDELRGSGAGRLGARVPRFVADPRLGSARLSDAQGGRRQSRPGR